MKLNAIKEILDHSGYRYKTTIVEKPKEFYREKGYLSVKDNNPFILLTIPNPNHEKQIELIFKNAEDNPDFIDLEFGNYWYELFDYTDEELSNKLIEEISDIVSGKVYFICAKNAKTMAWFFNGAYFDSPDEVLNNMDEFYKILERIRKPKNWWQRLSNRMDLYEIFNWECYERIVR